MFCSGAELRSLLGCAERRKVLGIAVAGKVVPFLAELAFVAVYDTSRFLGPAADQFSFTLVFALAIAVTSIPVISRIMADLGILGTRFARIVLSVAVLEEMMADRGVAVDHMTIWRFSAMCPTPVEGIRC